jgi:putative effector of murein hydrolase LrgA (UPF0299 family)
VELLANSKSFGATILDKTLETVPANITKLLLLLLLLKTLYVPQRAFQHTITICNLK